MMGINACPGTKGRGLSNEVMTIVKRRRIGGGPLRKAILFYMADSASDDGSGIWVSKLNMAADLEADPTTIRRHIKDMVEEGLIEEVGQRARSAGGFTMEYNLRVDVIRALPSTRSGTVPDRAENPAALGHHARPRSGTTPDKPSVEPSLEPNSATAPQLALEGGDSPGRVRRFSEFWESAFPHRDGVKRNKKDAEKRYRAAVKRGVPESLIIEKARAYGPMCRRIKKPPRDPATWLNQEGWTDEEAKTGGAIDPGEAALRWVDPILKGQGWVGRHVSQAMAKHLIDKGLVTITDCRRCGIDI